MPSEFTNTPGYLTHRRAIILGTAGLVFCLNLLILGPITLQAPFNGNGDFQHFYIGARLVSDNTEYDVATVLRLQTAIRGMPLPKLLPVRLPFYYELLSPLGKISYSSAHHIWFALILAATVAGYAIYPCADRIELAAAALASLPLLEATVVSQDIAIVFLILAVGLRLRLSGNPQIAGLILSLLLIKFHLFLGLPLVFLLKREKTLLAGVAFGSAALLGWCFLIGGRTWPRDFWRIASNPIGDPGPLVMPNLHAIAARFPASALVEILLALLAIGLLTLIVLRSNFELSLSAGLICSLLISHHCFASDCTVLVPAFLYFSREGQPLSRIAAFACLTPVPYLFMLTAYQHLGLVPPILFCLILVSAAFTFAQRGSLAKASF